MKTKTKAPRVKATAGMRSEYDFAKGVRGKSAGRLPAGASVVILDPDVAELFPTSRAVNDALRVLAKIIRSTRARRRRSRKSS